MERGNAVENHIDFRSTADFAIERRSEERTATVFRPILIETDQFAGFCLLRNLSPSGMRGQVYTSFAEGLPITVEFAPDRIVDGTVIWSKDEHVGIKFDGLVDVGQVLSHLARKLIEGKVNRAPRLQIECRAELAFGDRALPFALRDISQRGIKAVASFVKPGDEVWVRLEGLQRKAVVRWTQDGIAGMNFLRPLSFEELAHWVIRRQARPRLECENELPPSPPARDDRARVA
jgi:hypothetical protein